MDKGELDFLAHIRNTGNQFTRPGNATVHGAPVAHWIELLNPTTAETVDQYDHQYWGKSAAVTRSSFGKGRAWYVGAMVTKEVLQKYLRGAAADAGIEVPSLRYPLVLRSGVTNEGKNLRFLLNYSNTGISIRSQWSGTDLLSGATYSQGQTVTLPDWGVCILEEF